MESHRYCDDNCGEDEEKEEDDCVNCLRRQSLEWIELWIGLWNGLCELVRFWMGKAERKGGGPPPPVASPAPRFRDRLILIGGRSSSPSPTVPVLICCLWVGQPVYGWSAAASQPRFDSNSYCKELKEGDSVS